MSNNMYHKIFTLLGCYTAHIGSYLTTFCYCTFPVWVWACSFPFLLS